VGRVTGVGLVCELDNAGCVVVDFKSDRGLIIFGMDIAGCVIVELEKGQWLV
jgi:hypothetical protein